MMRSADRGAGIVVSQAGAAARRALAMALAAGSVLLIAAGAAAQQRPAGAPPPPSTPPPGLAPVDAPTLEDERPKDRVDFGALPLLNYNADTGIGFGANAQMFIRHDGYHPYQYALKVQGFATTGGYQDHYFSLDAPTFLGSPYRLSGQLGYHREQQAGFYGVTNFPDLLPQPPPGSKHFDAFDFSAFRFNVKVQRYLSETWRVAAQYSGAVQGIHPYAGSLLDIEPVSTALQGWYGELRGEVSYDSRDTEASATRGIYAGVGGAVAPSFFNAAWSYASADFFLQGYHSFFAQPYLVLAGRAVGTVMVGDVPLTNLSGLGGSGTLRGVPGGEYHGPRSLTLNLEARSRFVRFRPGGHTLDLWAVGFLDVGRVWVPGDFPVDAPLLGFHYSAGGGIRIAWEEDFVVRFDLGWAHGPLRGYLVFGQMF